MTTHNQSGWAPNHHPFWGLEQGVKPGEDKDAGETMRPFPW